MKKSILLASLALSATTFAEETKDTGWSGSGQLGITYASGNADTDSINAALTLAKEVDKWLHEIGVTALRATNNDVKTAERYTLNAKSGYKFSENDYVYGAYRHDLDQFSGFDYTQTLSAGWGHIFVNTEESKLISELGIGYKVEAFDIDRSENSGAVVTGKLDYMRQLTDTTTFENVLYVEAGDDNTFAQNDLGVSFKVSNDFAVKLAHQWRHNTDVAPGKEKTDTLFSANLVYDF